MGADPAKYEKVFMRKRLLAFVDFTVPEFCVKILSVR